jgi:4-alpha-glucanotransferase
MNEEAVLARARTAGVAVDWTDAMGRPQRVRTESLRRLLEALNGIDAAIGVPPLVTARRGRPIAIAGIDADHAGELVLEDGEAKSVAIRDGTLPGIGRLGYHRLRFADREITLAVAPPRCVTLQDIGGRERMWGVAAQVYSLRRAGDGGIGDAGAVRELAEAAARHGADAVALSPVHSLFPHDPARYGPYSPSSRLFLNPLYADPSATFDATTVGSDDALERAALIDWPAAGAAKFARLRALFGEFDEMDTPLLREFERFVVEGGEALRQHARFEAEQAAGSERYHLFLQWVTARSFAAAHQAAKAAGMRIGLLSDLAIGMDRAGSHAWARRSDYSGGVRIDHIMGLMRLWLIPRGQPAGEGAYLAYPLEDLLALLALESHRYGAVVIGEDLGTVPPGFRGRLRRAGISGMDVLWFERTRLHFKKPSRWRADAVAMTTTHDLPTVAGWWNGEDIRTRRALGLGAPGEDQARQQDRARLWRAFAKAGLDGPMPSADQPAPAVEAALGYVAQSPSPLMLAPLEDLLGLAEQPNLPGTIDEHPNWRRRLEPPARELFEGPAVRSRVDTIRRHRR